MNRVFVSNRVRTFNFQREAWNPLDVLLIVVLVHVARRARVLSRHASHERDRHVSLEALMHRRPVQQQRAASRPAASSTAPPAARCRPEARSTPHSLASRPPLPSSSSFPFPRSSRAECSESAGPRARVASSPSSTQTPARTARQEARTPRSTRDPSPLHSRPPRSPRTASSSAPATT